MQRAPIKISRQPRRIDVHNHRPMPVSAPKPLPVIPYIKKSGKVRIADQTNETFYSVKKMCEVLEFDGYSDEILVLAYNAGERFSSLKSRHPNDKIICYQLEQIYNDESHWFSSKATSGWTFDMTNNAKEWFNGSDEIWDYDLDNISYLQKMGYTKAKFMPMRYYEGIKTIDNSHKDIDILFYGSMNGKRRAHLNKLANYKTRIISEGESVWGAALDQLIGRSKIILNLHYYNSHLQEQVRMFPLIGNDCCVLSEVSRFNYFGDLIHEFVGDELVGKVEHLLQNDNYRNSVGISEKFKSRNIKIGAIYSTFHGLDQIQSSIDSLSPIVSHFVIVHQRTAHNGEQESEETKRIISELQKKHTVIFHDSSKDIASAVVDKRNIGLDYCKQAGCNYVIPIDTDEEYDCSWLMKEIYNMFDNDIETLYSPIQTYYHDRNHFFNDTYYVASVFKVNGRKFTPSNGSVLRSEERVMDERKYKVSETPMRHYCYLKEPYAKKVASKWGAAKEDFQKISNYINNWKEGMPAFAFTNTDNGIALAEIPLSTV